jgi:hypothetical protein
MIASWGLAEAVSVNPESSQLRRQKTVRTVGVTLEVGRVAARIAQAMLRQEETERVVRPAWAALADMVGPNRWGTGKYGTAASPLHAEVLPVKGLAFWRAEVLAHPDPMRQAAMMASATHATLATFRMDLSREAEQREGLERMIVPGVRQFPGFITGHWTVDRTAAESLVLLTYESLAAAQAMAENINGCVAVALRHEPYAHSHSRQRCDGGG